jgi:hypothetical protein
MDADRGSGVPLPGSGDSGSAERAEVHRDGIRHARRVSNWTAAALIAGTATAVVALAHQAVPVTAPTAGTGAPAAGAAAPAAGAGARSGAPQVTHSVATTSPSGVTTTTTTQTVNGKTIVTRARNAPARGDD